MAKRMDTLAADMKWWSDYLADAGYGDKALFTIVEVATILGYSRTTVYYSLIAKGKLLTTGTAENQRVTRLSLVGYLARAQRRGT
jgi:hypothetical protein